jgi:hypothetical protein
LICARVAKWFGTLDHPVRSAPAEIRDLRPFGRNCSRRSFQQPLRFAFLRDHPEQDRQDFKLQPVPHTARLRQLLNTSQFIEDVMDPRPFDEAKGRRNRVNRVLVLTKRVAPTPIFSKVAIA